MSLFPVPPPGLRRPGGLYNTWRDGITGDKVMDGQDIKTIRTGLGLSQREFAEKLEVTRLTIARWESGTRTPDEANQKRLLQIAKENGLDTKLKIVSSNDENVSSKVDTLDTNLDTKSENVSSEMDTNSEIVSNEVDTLDTKTDGGYNFNNIPPELREYKNWVCWKTVKREGKPTKIPVSITGENASATASSTWTSFEKAREYYGNHDEIDGIGFVFTENDPFCGIDLDKCRNAETGEIDEWALKWIEKFNSYTEVSPSEKGAHVITKGKKKGSKCRKDKVEIYDKERFFTITGNVLDGYRDIKKNQEALDGLYDAVFTKQKKKQSKPKVEISLDDQTLIEKAMNAKNGAKFTALWEGDVSGYPSESEADLALCSMLAFWTGGDPDRIDRLFRQSGLYREKWDREDYREKTINAALEQVIEYYDGNGKRMPLFERLNRQTQEVDEKQTKEEYEGIISGIDANLEKNVDELSSIEESELIQDTLAQIAKLNKTDQARYIKLLSEKFDVTQKALKDDMKAMTAKESVEIEGRHFGNIYEVDGYNIDGERSVGYLKVDRQTEFISTFVIKPKSKLWIDNHEAMNVDFISPNKKVENIVIERQNWNSPDNFMSVIPSTDMNWSGEGRKDIQAIMSIVSRSYDVPVQIATRQIGWHKEKIWVAPNLNMGNDGLIEPVKVFYYPMGRHNVIDDIVSYKECTDERFAELQTLSLRLLELNESDVTIPIIGWFHGAFTKRWWLDHPNLRHFPHLNVAGSRGSGKSTLIEILWSVFGWVGDALPNCAASRFALLRTFSSANSFPIVLDEFKPANMPKDRVANLREFLRHSYGGAVDQRGRPDQSIVEYHLTAPICLVGETPYYPLEAAAIERVIPVHMTINAINPETELGAKRVDLCYELQRADWAGYLPRYIRYLMTIDLDTQIEYAREDAARYLGDRDIPRRIWDNIAAMVFGLRQYENFANIVVDDGQIEHAVQTIATCLCGEAGKRGKLAFELALEQMAVMAELGKLRHEVHYLINESDQICLRLSACLSEFRRFARETNWTGEVLDDNAYRRQIAEIHEEGRLIIETSRLVRGWRGDYENRARAVVIQSNDQNVDLEGFLLASTDKEEY